MQEYVNLIVLLQKPASYTAENEPPKLGRRALQLTTAALGFRIQSPRGPGQGDPQTQRHDRDLRLAGKGVYLEIVMRSYI